MLYQRKLFIEFAQKTLAVFVVLLTILVVFQFTTVLGQAASGRFATDAVLVLTGFQLIQVTPPFLVLSIFIGTFMTFLRLWRDQEMAVWLSSGLAPSAWFQPIWMFAIPMAGLIAFFSLNMGPWAAQLAMQYHARLLQRSTAYNAPTGVFKEIKNGKITFFVENSAGADRTTPKIFIKSEQKNNTSIIVAALNYAKTVENGGQFLIMENGRRYEPIHNPPGHDLVEFGRYTMRLGPRGSLTTPMAALNPTDPTDRAQLHADWHWRLAMPIAAVLLACFAPVLARFQPNQSRSYGIIAALLIAFIYMNFLNIAQAMISQQRWPNGIGLWPIHAAALAILAVLITVQQSNSAPRPSRRRFGQRLRNASTMLPGQ